MYVVVQGGMILVRKTKDGKLLSKFSLYRCTLDEYEPEKMEGCFVITNEKTKIILRADSEEEMHYWLNVILMQKIIIEETIDMITI
jgi:hypothetical protein